MEDYLLTLNKIMKVQKSIERILYTSYSLLDDLKNRDYNDTYDSSLDIVAGCNRLLLMENCNINLSQFLVKIIKFLNIWIIDIHNNTERNVYKIYYETVYNEFDKLNDDMELFNTQLKSNINYYFKLDNLLNIITDIDIYKKKQESEMTREQFDKIMEDCSKYTIQIYNNEDSKKDE